MWEPNTPQGTCPRSPSADQEMMLGDTNLWGGEQVWFAAAMGRHGGAMKELAGRPGKISNATVQDQVEL